MLNRCELYEKICEVALSTSNNAWKIEPLGDLLEDLNELFRIIDDNHKMPEKCVQCPVYNHCNTGQGKRNTVECHASIFRHLAKL